MRTVQECPIEEEIPDGLRLQGRRWGCTGEEPVGQAVQLLLIVPALEGQLAYRVPLDYPLAEPLHFPHATNRGIAPTERVSAGAAKPPLATVRIAAVPLGHAPALRTVFFGVMKP